MRKLVARVLVYTDDSPFGECSYTEHENGTRDYEIQVNPECDKRNGAPHGDSETIMAHEFGHLIAQLHGYPEQTMSGFPNTPIDLRIKGEHTAWRFAEEAWPGVNQQAKQEALGTYYKEAERVRQLWE